VGRVDGDHLEQLPHLVAAGQTLHGIGELRRALRIGVGKGCRASADTEAVQPLTLGDYRRHRCACVGCSACDGFEVDVGCQILLAGAVEHGSEGVAAYRLQRVPRCTLCVAIVDEKRDPAIGFCQGTPMRGEIEAQAPGAAGLQAATNVAAAALAAEFGDGPIEAPMQALVIVAR